MQITGPHPRLQTPKATVKCLHLLYSALSSATTHPPSPPPLMQDPTPDMLSALFRSRLGIKIRGEVHELLQWKEQNLKDLWGMWEYDSESFIIKCMPTPMHESFTGYAYEQIICTIRVVTGKSVGITGVQVLTNSSQSVNLRSPFLKSSMILVII